jgi:hypothetical protein
MKLQFECVQAEQTRCVDDKHAAVLGHYLSIIIKWAPPVYFHGCMLIICLHMINYSSHSNGINCACWDSQRARLYLFALMVHLN